MNLYLSKNMPAYMRVYADFASNYIGLDKLRGEVCVKLKYGTIDDDSYGLCWGDNYGAEIDIATVTCGESISREDKLKTLGHELVHARQYLKRELVAPNAPKHCERWQGIDMMYDPVNESSMPWELEATKLEDEIYNAFLKWSINK
tara:strand:- start:1052 stop:1489 length:438 start_codon:yes stop_codon:yes gene_type:complete